MILVRNLRLDIGQSSDRLKVKAARAEAPDLGDKGC